MQLVPIELAIKAMLIAVGTAAVLRMLNIKTAAARHAAWAGVMVVMLLLPLWTVWGPKVAVRLLPPVAGQAATYTTAGAAAFEPAIGLPDATPVPRHPEWNWTVWLVGIYLIGAAVFLARLTLGTMQAHLMVRRAYRRDGDSFSGACSGPVTVGWFRPVVVLPESWSEWPAAQLDAVLTHEREHVRRRDPLFQWLALLNRALFWFHPLAWWLERRIAALAEEACDAVVLAQGHDPRDYSKYLIDMARSVASSGARIQVWGMAMPGGFLEERIRRILEGGPLPQISRTRLVCAFIACAVTSAAFATSTLDRQHPARRPDQKIVAAPAGRRAAIGLPAPLGTPDGPVPTVIRGPLEAQRQHVTMPFNRADIFPAAAQVATQNRGILGGMVGPVTNLKEPEVLTMLSIRGLSPEATAELRQRLQLQEGQMIDNAAFERAKTVAREFDAGLTVSMATTMEGAPGREGMRKTGVALIVAPARIPISGSPLTDVPRRLHVDIQGLSPEATSELLQRLALRDGEIFDHAAFVKELERIHQVVKDFDPHLNDSRMTGRVPRNVGADGKLIPPDVIDNTLLISPRDSAQMEQFSRVAKPPGNALENVAIKLHLDFQGLSSEAAAELRRRIGVREGETTDSETLKKTVSRIRQTLSEFDPRLMDEMNFDFPPRKFGADGKPIPWDSVDARMVIKYR